MRRQRLTSPRRRLVTFLILAAGLAALVGPSASGSGSTAAFDWQMPERLGQDANGDGLIDARDTPGEVRPSTWDVDLDACASTGAIETYRWSVDGIHVGQSSSCSFSHEFPDEGTYTVALTTVDSDGDEVSVTKDVVVQDWLIVALGDSYGSGEGTPDEPIPGFRFDNVRQAAQNLASKLAELADVEDAYDDTVAKANTVRQRLSNLNAALADENRFCNPFSPEANIDQCLAATEVVIQRTDELLNALVALGLQTLIDTLGLIEESLQELIDAAQAAVDLAQTAVDEGRNALNQAKALLSPTWQNERCHRSSKSGQARAALALENADPRTSVTLVHLACSGGEIVNGVIGSYAGAVPPPGAENLPPQVDRALGLVGDREIDALVMSIGGNDANFGPIVESCIVLDPCHALTTAVASFASFVSALCAPFDFMLGECSAYWDNLAEDAPFADSGEELRAEGAAFLTGANDRYDRLSDRLVEAFPQLPPSRTYITEYPNATENDDGSICTFDALDPLAAMPGFSTAESQWARDSVTIGLNALVQSAAADHGWNFIGGIYDDFANHGYCADDHWFVRFQETFQNQGDYLGVVHPNFDGHRIYRDHIRDSLRADLYVGGDLATPRRPQQPPTAEAGGPYTLDEGAQITLDNGSFDRNNDPLSFTWSVDASLAGKAALSDAHLRQPTLVGRDDASGNLGLAVGDGFSTRSDTAAVTIRNRPPSLAAASDRSLTEGGSLALSLPFTDPGTLDTHSASVDWGDGSAVQNVVPDGGTISASHAYADEGEFTVTARVSDDDGGADSETFRATVANAPPEIGPITATLDPVMVGSTVDASAPFSDAGALDTHTATWSWDDGTTSIGALAETGGTGQVAGSRTFTAAGVYEIALTVRDNDGGFATRTFQYVVVYDPSAGFVTGAGQIDSPAGAYRLEPALSGRASFGFVSRYQKGATAPTGRTDFGLKFASFEFESESYQWLVVAGSKAQYKGVGTVNGTSGYGFMLTAHDGGTGKGVDSFRIKIWKLSTDDLVYDNKLGAADDIDADNTQAIAAGSIVIHK